MLCFFLITGCRYGIENKAIQALYAVLSTLYAVLSPLYAVSVTCAAFSNSELKHALTGSKFDVINQSTFLTQSFNVTHAVHVVKNVAFLSSLYIIPTHDIPSKHRRLRLQCSSDLGSSVSKWRPFIYWP